MRATLTTIEALLWQLKQHLMRDTAIVAKLSIHEQAALLEESCAIDDRGIVRPQRRFLPVTTSIRLVARILQKFQPEYTIDFSMDLWKFMQDAVDIRNRLVHPFSWKRASGLSSAKRQLSKQLGVPLTKAGRQRKLGKALGCCVPAAFIVIGGGAAMYVVTYTVRMLLA